MTPFQEAKAKGLVRFFTGKPCPRGHIGDRYVSNRRCAACIVEDKKVWAKNNPGAVKEYQRKFGRENRDSIFIRNKRWRSENPAKVKAQKQAEYLRNKDKILARNKLYRQSIDKNIARESDRKKREKNPESYRAYKKNYKARKRQAKGSHTGEDIRAIFKLQRGKCAYCRQKVGKKYHVDHIQSLFRGGTNDRTNLQISCARCNHTKHAKDPMVFARSLGMLL